jgi:serine/threonine-protein kinase HipA
VSDRIRELGYRLRLARVRRWSGKPNDDRIELFRRMVLNAAVTNNDDHHRNHALRRTARNWELTPAYDLVPAPLVSLERRDLAMTVGTYGRTASVYNLLSQSERFGLSTDAAKKEIDAIVATVRTWRDHFQAASVPAKDIEYISPAFLPECSTCGSPWKARREAPGWLLPVRARRTGRIDLHSARSRRRQVNERC